MFRTFTDYIETYSDYIDPRMVTLLENNLTCECGSEFMLNDEKTIIVCGNSGCPYKVGKRLQQMCQDMSIMGIGEQLALKIVKNLEIESPILMLAYNPDEDGYLADGISDERCWDFYEQIHSKEMQLWEYLRAANIPSIRDNAVKVMKGIDSFEQLYENLDGFGVEFIEDQLGLKKKEEYSIMAMQIYEGLMSERPYLLHVEPYLNIPAVSHELTIAVSRGITGFSSKEAYIKTLNSNFSGRVYLNLVQTMSSNVDILIWEGIGNPTSKVQKAYKLGTPVMTSEEFEDYLSSNY